MCARSEAKIQSTGYQMDIACACMRTDRRGVYAKLSRSFPSRVARIDDGRALVVKSWRGDESCARCRLHREVEKFGRRTSTRLTRLRTSEGACAVAVFVAERNVSGIFDTPGQEHVVDQVVRTAMLPPLKAELGLKKVG